MRIKNSPGQSGRRSEFGYRPRQTWLGTVYATFNKGPHKGLHKGLHKGPHKVPHKVLHAGFLHGCFRHWDCCRIETNLIRLKLMAHPIMTEQDVEFSAIRASGPGGQNVNKVATAVQLRFAIHASRLSSDAQTRLAGYADARINKDAVIVIKAQRFRSQDKNKQDALARLNELISDATHIKRRRIATRPGRAVVEQRLQQKKKKGTKKFTRGPIGAKEF